MLLGVSMRVSVSRRVEDYLRVVYEVVEVKGYARIRDISRAVSYTHLTLPTIYSV